MFKWHLVVTKGSWRLVYALKELEDLSMGIEAKYDHINRQEKSAAAVIGKRFRLLGFGCGKYFSSV